MICAATGGAPSNVVDIFNGITGNWSTAVLSVARRELAATSLPHLGLAIFAGGQSTCCHVDFSYLMRVALNGLWNRILECAGFGLLIACASLMPCSAGSVIYSDVDIFNVTSGAWSTANLSVARRSLAATSLPNLGLAIFAGGSCTSRYFQVFLRYLVCEGSRVQQECAMLCDRISCIAQQVAATPVLWTSSTQQHEFGGLHLSACLEIKFQSRHCQISDSHSSLVAPVRNVKLI